MLGFVVPDLVEAQEKKFDCLIEPYRVVEVGSVATGIVQSMTVDRGSLVEKDQILATLESSLQEISVKVAQAQAETESTIKTNRARLDFSERRLRRTKELHANEISSLNELDEAETSYLLAQLNLIEALDNQRIRQLEFQRAETELYHRTIRSPISGVVIERFLTPGELAEKVPFFQIAQIDPLLVKAYVPLTLWRTLTIGSQAVVTPEAPFNEDVLAHVMVIDKVINSSNQTFGVHLKLPNTENHLPAGLRCTIRFRNQ